MRQAPAGQATVEGSSLDRGAAAPSLRDALHAAELFQLLPQTSLDLLLDASEVRTYPADSVVVAEGESDDRVYIVLDGAATVTSPGLHGPVELAVLGDRDVFGEVVALDVASKRQATVRALTPLRTLAIPSGPFRQAVAAHEDVRIAFDRLSRRRLLTRFLRTISPFASLGPARLDVLAASVETRQVEAGTVLFRQGDEGDACYLIQSGQVSVELEEPGGTTRNLATLYPGALVGEAALLTGTTRNATVTAIMPCRLVVLRRADFLAMLAADRPTAFAIVEQWQLRNRPRQKPGTVFEHQVTPSGEPVTILRHPTSGAYYRLSQHGWFIWQRLDGNHAPRDLMMAYWDEFNLLAPQAIAEIVAGLTAAGFLESPGLDAGVREQVVHLTPRERALLLLARVLDVRLPLARPDAVIGWLYRHGGRLLVHPFALVPLSLLAVAGIVSLVLDAGATAPLTPAELALVAVWLIPARFCSVVIHELAHGLATKAAGREVTEAGVGLMWFMPFAYVDTTDTWLASRRARIAVSLAGPFCDLVVGGLAALAAYAASDPLVVAAFRQFAFLCYASAAFNLCPGVKADGYYVLADLLDRPHLRRQSFAWLGHELLDALRDRSKLRGHVVDLVYSVGSIVYLAVLMLLVVTVYRAYIQQWLTGVLPDVVTLTIAWVLPLLLPVLAALGIVSELRASPTRRPGSASFR